MSEHLSRAPESLPGTEALRNFDLASVAPERQIAAERPDAAVAAEQAVQQARPAAEMVLPTSAEQAAIYDHTLHQRLKSHAYAQTLEQTRQSLSPVARSFSRFVHNPAVDSISATASRSVGRPSGILGGSIGALVGSLWLLYAAKHYGYAYNYTLCVLLFVAGFSAGLFVELLIHAARAAKRR